MRQVLRSDESCLDRRWASLEFMEGKQLRCGSYGHLGQLEAEIKYSMIGVGFRKRDLLFQIPDALGNLFRWLDHNQTEI